MQNTVTATQNTSTNVEVRKEDNKLEQIFKACPKILLERGLISEADWFQLALESKKSLLISAGIDLNNFIEVESQKLSTQPEEAAIPQETVIPESNVIPTEESQPQEILEIKNQFDEVKKQIDESEKATEITENRSSFAEVSEDRGEITDKAAIPELTAEEKQRIAVETSTAQNTMQAPKLFGYQASAQIASQSDDISVKGDVKESKTWLATLIRKILLSFKE